MIDTYAKVGFAKLYDSKTPITAADTLNDRVLPFFEAQGIAVSRVLTDRGTEYCGHPQSHPYELYLAVENIDHTRTKAKSPQTNGICARFNKTLARQLAQIGQGALLRAPLRVAVAFPKQHRRRRASANRITAPPIWESPTWTQNQRPSTTTVGKDPAFKLCEVKTSG